MGGNKSKVEASARDIIARRKGISVSETYPQVLQQQQHVANENNLIKNISSKHINLTIPIDAANLNPSHVPIEPTILKEMSTWISVQNQEAEVTKQQQRLVIKQDSATVTRLNEEKTIMKAHGGKLPTFIDGRLTETKLLELYCNLRDKPDDYTVDRIAAEYKISADIVRRLLSSARKPIIVTEKQGNNQEQLIAK